ncbi:hypothetical protein SODALDRAFT_328021 [Sodiomyces alkalinus F11]|uniref:Zinc finger double-stranded RNA binding domain-containing protein n=1 Tax=Sodiomyces alkalinus (strain CBS 110278 / VKM F-3762 / F11) TaxID=1314773 RepID=A0A3N2QAN3_SODAK|nr:hypothetical protein SODALDRAFT_328021 [Sodiomyces alkalinus F11]ROT43813.1 hypothetical protein SODALDRAFT_328021 [Sodiomyces alkalinus F11]
MADARALLRQQRAARRIDHPHAAYSDLGKLLCVVCHESMKTESLWDSHIRSRAHVAKLQAKAKAKASATTASAAVSETSTLPNNKRKHDWGSGEEEGPTDEETARTKRSKGGDVTASAHSSADASSGFAAETVGSQGQGQGRREASKDKGKDLQETARTPPSLTRRLSTTPGQGVELQIPSRPATPQHRDGTSSATPITTPSAAPPRRPSNLAVSSSKGPEAAQVDEDEWAAFEADIATTSVAYDEDAAVISAPPMTAEEQAAAAKSEEEERERRRVEAEEAVADEKEEAARALELEFEEMEELEARVRRLKERREALRAKTADEVGVDKVVVDAGKENLRETAANGVGNGEDEEDDEEDDDFMGFRFKA